jgi:putative oxidoreductase
MNRVFSRTDLGLLLLRVMLGIVFAFHGAQKLFGWFGGYGLSGTAGWMDGIGIPLPTLSALLAGLSELGGGLVLLGGLGFAWALPPLAFTMLVAVTVGHAGKGFAAQSGGFEYPLTLLVAVAALWLTGPGRLVLPLAVPRTREAHA